MLHQLTAFHVVVQTVCRFFCLSGLTFSSLLDLNIFSHVNFVHRLNRDCNQDTCFHDEMPNYTITHFLILVDNHFFCYGPANMFETISFTTKPTCIFVYLILMWIYMYSEIIPPQETFLTWASKMSHKEEIFNLELFSNSASHQIKNEISCVENWGFIAWQSAS